MKILLSLLLLITLNLQAEIKVLAFSGSLQKDSVNTKLIAQAALIAKQQGASVSVIHLRDFPIPFYDSDLESAEGMPPKAKEFRRLMIESDLIFIASPEYNGSVSGVLKNIIDWASRDENKKYSQKAFAGKTFFLMSASPSMKGGTAGLQALRAILETVGGSVFPVPFSLPVSYQAFDEQGRLKRPEQQEALEKAIIDALASYQVTSGGNEHKMASGFPPEAKPNLVPRS